ncbi:MAG TPA: hypothetical protein VFM12_06410, partial [Gemmatimonadales bacterium]|nr:hypothetical protein [Gemmatimonadales bacterium]
IVAGWMAGRITGRRGFRPVLAVSCAIQAVTWAGIPAAGAVWATAGLFVLLGAAAAVGTVAVVAARQELTPDAMLGRATSVFRLLGIGVSSLAALAGGAIAGRFGLAAPMLAAAGILAALAGWVSLPRRHS